VVFSEKPNEADMKMFLATIANRTSLRVGVAPAPFLTPLSFALKTLPGSSRGPRGELVSDPLPKNLATSGAVLEGEATWGVFPELKPTSPPLLRYWFSAHEARSQRDWAFVDAQSRNRLAVSIRVQRCNSTTGVAEAEVVARFDGVRLSRAEVSLFGAEGDRAGSVNTSEAGDAYVVLPLGKPAYAMVNFEEKSKGVDRGKAYEAVAHYATHAASVECRWDIHVGQDMLDEVHAIRRNLGYGFRNSVNTDERVPFFTLLMNSEDISDSHIWIATCGCLGVALLLGGLCGSRQRPQSFLEETLTLSPGGRKGLTPKSIGESVLLASPRRAPVEALRQLTSPKASPLMPGQVIASSPSVAPTLQDRFHADEPRLCCGVPFTENMRVLALTAALFAFITVAQLIAASVAKSDALLADCVSMAVDAMTYLLNIFVEAREGKAFHRELQCVVPAISLSVLFFFTVSMLLEAKETLAAHAGDGAADDEVDPTIILGFASLGILFDAIALRAFLQDADKGSMNMFAAFAHVGADFLRSIVTFAAAILIMNGHDGMRTDAWACVIVTGLILAGVLFAAYEWSKEMRSYVRHRSRTGSIYAPSLSRREQVSLELPPTPPLPFNG
jgi:Co/Zn/Cd efflux system component